MIKRRRFPRIFFGWWTVITSGVLSLWVAGYHVYGFSAFFKPISSELGFSRAAMSAAGSISRFEGSFEAPLAGWLSDKFGPRWLVLLGVFLFGLGLTLMYFIHSLWVYYVVWGVITGGGANLIMGAPLSTALANWFVKKRGTATGIRFVLIGLGGAVLLLVVAPLITTVGWRMTNVVGGMVIWLVGIPLVWFTVKRHRPEYYGLLPDGATTEERVADAEQMIDKGIEYAGEVQEVEFTLRQVWRTPSYWLLIIANATHSMVQPAISMHGIPFLTDMGIEPQKAANLVGMMVLVGLPARLVSGLLADRIGKQHLRFLMLGTFILSFLGITIFLLHQTIGMVYVWFILHGIGWGSAVPLTSVVNGRYFGRKAFGSLSGFSGLFMAPVGIAAPIYLGWVYDTTGSYLSAFTLAAVLLAVAAAILPFAVPPKPPAQITSIREIV